MRGNRGLSTAVVLLTLFLAAVAGFLLLSAYFSLLIDNRSEKRILVQRVSVWILPIQNKPVVLEPMESYSISAVKFSAFPRLLIEMTDDKGNKKNASCVLDVHSSDLCRVVITGDGALNCSECYK